MRAATLEWECSLSIPPPAGVGEQIVAFHATQQQIMYFLDSREDVTRLSRIGYIVYCGC